jgi:TRAP-type mannitol/chloroaromatic compound transport system permease small subunit
VRVSLIRAIPGKGLALAVELACLASTFAIFGFIALQVWRILVRDFTSGSVSPTLMETPTWYIDAAILAGLVLLLIQILASALDAIANGVPEDAQDGD